MNRVKASFLFVFTFLAFSILGALPLQVWAGYYPGMHSIAVHTMTPLHKQPISVIYSLRKARVEENKVLGIFPENYTPSASIYSQIDERADWVHDTQFFVNNPYLLVVISGGNYVNAFLPYCYLNSVDYSHGKITETYRGSSAQKWFFFAFDYYPDVKGIIRLWFVNAYDAGFKYAHIDSSKSINIDMDYPQAKDSLLTSIYSGNEFFHVGHLKKNNISPFDVRATVRLKEKNAKTAIYVKLWKNRPSDKSAKEDFAYLMKIEL
jgi:hypothetical protein